MELRQLRYFVVVAQEKNFTRASEKLHMAQPPLSRQIQQLEAEFGTSLIERGSRPLRLTDAGRLFFEQAVQVLERIEAMKAMMHRLQQIEQPRFCIGFVASTLYGKLPEVIRRYRAARLKVELTLVELTSLEQTAALKEGRINAGFGRFLLSDDPTIQRTLLRREKLSAALPQTHRLSRAAGSLKLEELAAEPLIIYPKAPRPSYADQVLALFRDRGLTPTVVHEVRELQTALGLVAAESGICLVPASVERLRRDNVVYRPLDGPDAVSPIVMSTRKGDPSPDIALILRLIRDMYRKEKIEFGV